ncbi:hypothetical protein MKS88_002219 [Plasmodium brasilianum]|uniref:Uncharacterized protein n=1 Tax=Plasmodium brasilianum TaxID=5824 RepID=A0ACB9YC97_PLABR|nr:hypothetical protein MKS88_002219 [Plasmodium brasilianum]
MIHFLDKLCYWDTCSDFSKTEFNNGTLKKYDLRTNLDKTFNYSKINTDSDSMEILFYILKYSDNSKLIISELKIGDKIKTLYNSSKFYNKNNNNTSEEKKKIKFDEIYENHLLNIFKSYKTEVKDTNQFKKIM